MIKLKIERCPECGAPVKGTSETLLGRANLFATPDGWEYTGDTEVFWNEQRTIRDECDRIELLCEDGHSWFSEYTEE